MEYTLYPLIGCRLALNFPEASHLRRVTSDTPRRAAACLIVMMSGGPGGICRPTPKTYNLDQVAGKGVPYPSR